MRHLHLIAIILLIIGGINWGLIGLIEYNFVASIFGSLTPLTRLIYILVGVAAIYELVLLIRSRTRA